MHLPPPVHAEHEHGPPNLRKPSPWLPPVVRDSPPWLGSLIVHLTALIVLALLVTKGKLDRSPLLVTSVTQDAPDLNAPAVSADVEAESPIPPASVQDLFIPRPDSIVGSLEDPDPLSRIDSFLAGGDRLGRGDGSVKVEGRASLFGIQSAGRKFIYLLDHSASMQDYNLLELAKKEVSDSLDKLSPNSQFQLLFYNEEVSLFNPTPGPDRFITASKQNILEARGFLETIYPFDGTDHLQALLRAIRMRPDVIFLWTDANAPRLGRPELRQIYLKANRIVINTIEVGFGPQADPNNFLVQLARQNRGQHKYLDISQLRPPQ